jgi:SAM-dependent methyltransferase
MIKLQDNAATTEDALLMDPWDWQKFDGPSPPGSAYFYFVRNMGNVQGKRIIEAGCGTGWLSIILAKRGAHVYGFDISSEVVRVARQRAKINGVENQVSFKVISFENINHEYEDQYFDLAVGCAILHHVNRENIIEPLRRVLKQDGKATFLECFGNSKWLERLRLIVPVPVDEENKSHWQEQLKYSDLKKFHRSFANVSWREFHLFSRLHRVVKNESFICFLNRFDEALFRLIPALRRYARLVVLEVEKPLNKEQVLIKRNNAETREP